MKFTLAAAMISSASAYMNEPATSQNMADSINKMDTTWTAHVSPRFTNATNADVASLCGTFLPDHPDFYELPEETHLTGTMKDVPDTFDSTTDFPGCEATIGHVRDQSNCGSCWAFGSSEAFNDRRCIAHGDKVWYAAEDVLACCSGIKCGMSMGCNGGQPASAWSWLVKTGVTTGGDESMKDGSTCNPYPFAACAHHVDPTDDYPACPSDGEYPTPKCTKECIDDKFEKKYDDDKVKALTSYSVKGEDKIMEEIGQPASAWSWLVKTGVTTGGDESMKDGSTCNPYPFAACAHHVDPTDDYPACPSDGEYPTPKCTKECIDDKFEKKYDDDKVKALTSYSVKGEDKIMEEISTNGPVTAAFTVYEDFVSYSTGVYQHTTGKQLGGHAIEIVGYGEENGTKYWKIKNSWNPTWGDKGFFKILRGSNECGIENQISAGSV